MKKGDKVVWLDLAHETSHVTTIIKIKGDIILCSNGTTELECLSKELTTLEGTFCHKECGCIDIQSEAWSYQNYIEGENPHKGFVDSGTNYCPNCKKIFEDNELVSVKEFLNNKNNDNSN